MSSIADGKVVHFHYTLKNQAGEVLDSSAGREPMPYLHGAGNIVPGLERQLAGLKVGDTVDATVEPEEGYGTVDDNWPQQVPRDAFPGDIEIQAGMQFFAQSPDGGHFPVWIARVDDDSVWVDGNHPLAGETLYFAVEIVEIRDATAEEQAHGHPHGPDGHGHDHGHGH